MNTEYNKYNKYSEAKRNITECFKCHTRQGRMYVEMISRQPRFVCVKHHNVDKTSIKIGGN